MRPAGLCEVPFRKYSVLGNTFVIVRREQLPPGTQVDRLARQVLDPDFGVGADNLLVLANAHSSSVAQALEGDIEFRIFEQDGSETLSCGNGLLASCDFLKATQALDTVAFWTELPAHPVRVTGLTDTTALTLSAARPIPAQLLDRRRLPADLAPDGAVEAFTGLSLAAGPAGLSCELEGYLTYTGEPHMVLQMQDNLKALECFGSEDSGFMTRGPDGVVAYDSELMRCLGEAVTEQLRDAFPQGVHVSIVSHDQSGDEVWVRTYERAIYKETRACGTGAAAVAEVLWHASSGTRQSWRVCPVRAQLPATATRGYRVTRRQSGEIVLETGPTLVATGAFHSELSALHHSCTEELA